MQSNTLLHTTEEQAPAIAEQTWEHPEAPLIHKIGVSTAIVVPTLGAVAAMIYSWNHGWLDWTQLGILAGMQLVTALGITVGYHRLLTHRSFKTYYWIKCFWMMMGALAFQKSPLEWCATHRKHHALSDQPGDPHSPLQFGTGFINRARGFVHAHIGWIFTGHILSTDHRRYVPDLLDDPWIVWVHRYWELVWFPATFAIPALLAWVLTGTAQGALLGFLWGGCFRVLLVQHFTFAVNSFCHMFGRRDYASNDDSRNNWICGILSAGEGFHNNHHAFPTSARHGLEWWQPDLSWGLIRTMQLLGLAWDVKLPTQEMRDRKRLSSPQYQRSEVFGESSQ